MKINLDTENKVNVHDHFDNDYRDDSAKNYQKYFVPVIGKPIAADLIKIADIESGENVVDVACGTGVAAILAKEKTGKNGTVAGVDLNPGMLDVARSVTPENVAIDWYQSSAENLPLNDNYFDVALCSLSFQFFSGKLSALREIHRILVPGGRLAFIVPGPTPIFEDADDSFVRHLGEEAAGFVRAVFSLNDHDEISELLQNAGFKNVNVRSEKKDLVLPPPEEFLWQYISSTPLSVFLKNLDAEKYIRFEREIVKKWRPFMKNNHLILEHEAVIATAVK